MLMPGYLLSTFSMEDICKTVGWIHVVQSVGGTVVVGTGQVVWFADAWLSDFDMLDKCKIVGNGKYM